MAFELKYHFKKDNTVVISHIHGGNIRAADDSDDAISNDGGKGKWAQWFCELQGDDKIKLKNKSTGKYLRIKKGGDIDVGGGGGKWTVFEVEVIEAPNVVKLKSVETGKYISVKPNKRVNKGTGGKHCKLTFYRNGGGGGGGKAKQAADDDNDGGDDDNKAEPEEKAPEPPADTDDDDDYDEEQDKDAEDAKIPEEGKPLGEDAEAVKAWLETIGHGDYTDAFIEAGYDKMGTVAMVDIDDLEKMGVKPGHRKELMIAAQCAQFINHWVAFRSQHKKRFLAADKGNKKKVELDDKADPKDAQWFIEQSPNGNNLVRFRSKYNSYLKMCTNQDKHLQTVSKEKDIDNRTDLQLLPCTDERRQNVVRVWAPINANFMTYDDNILKDRVNSKEEQFDKDDLKKQQWEIIIKG